MGIARWMVGSIILLRAGATPAAWALPNPAAQFCVTVGGQQRTIVSQAGESALCDLDTGSIEAWTLFRYANGAASQAVQAYLDHPAPSTVEANEANEGNEAGAAYCAQVAGTSVHQVARDGSAVALCHFEDRSVIEQQTLFAGPQGAGHARLNAVLEQYGP